MSTETKDEPKAEAVFNPPVTLTAGEETVSAVVIDSDSGRKRKRDDQNDKEEDDEQDGKAEEKKRKKAKTSTKREKKERKPKAKAKTKANAKSKTKSKDKIKTKTKGKNKSKTKNKKTPLGLCPDAEMMALLSPTWSAQDITSEQLNELNFILMPERWRDYVVTCIFSHYNAEFLTLAYLYHEHPSTEDESRGKLAKLNQGAFSMQRYLTQRLTLLEKISTPYQACLYQVCQCVSRLEARPVEGKNGREYDVQMFWNAFPFYRNQWHRVPQRMYGYCNKDNLGFEKFMAEFTRHGSPLCPPQAPIRVSNQLYQRLNTWVQMCCIQDAIELHTWTWARAHLNDWQIWQDHDIPGSDKNEFGIDIQLVHETFPFTHVRTRLLRWHKDLASFMQDDLDALKRKRIKAQAEASLVSTATAAAAHSSAPPAALDTVTPVAVV